MVPRKSYRRDFVLPQRHPHPAKWANTSDNKPLTHCDFVQLLKKVIDRMTPDQIKNGFKKTGIWPLNAENLQLDRCIGAETQQGL